MQNLRKATSGTQKSRPRPRLHADKSELVPHYVTVILPEKIRVKLEYAEHAMFFSDLKAFRTALTGGWGNKQKA
jgi:hypothetical protein